MPIATVDEDGHSGSPEYYVGPDAPAADVETQVLAIAEATGVQRRAQRTLGGRVGPPIGLHRSAGYVAACGRGRCGHRLQAMRD